MYKPRPVPVVIVRKDKTEYYIGTAHIFEDRITKIQIPENQLTTIEEIRHDYS